MNNNENTVLKHFLRINRLRMRHMRTMLGPLGYTGTMHLQVLYIGRNPGSSQEDIASWYALDKASVARDARKLEETGHIRRELCKDDRRQYRMYLTEAGEEMKKQILAEADRYNEMLLEGLDEEEKRMLCELMDRVEANSVRINEKQRDGQH